MEEKKIKFRLERATKNTYRYQEVPLNHSVIKY